MVTEIFCLFFHYSILVIFLSISFEFLAKLFNNFCKGLCPINIRGYLLLPVCCLFAIHLRESGKVRACLFEIPIGRVGDIGGSVDCRIFSKQS